jgi:hypothetical protein
MDGGNTGDFKVKIFEGQPKKVENHPSIILKCFGHGVFAGFTIEITNYVPTKLLADMVTTQNYYYKPQIVQSNLKNVSMKRIKTVANQHMQRLLRRHQNASSQEEKIWQVHFLGQNSTLSTIKAN